MALVGLIANFFDKALLAVIAPVYADRVYGSATSLGLLVGAFGIGAFSGSLIYGTIGRSWPRRLTFLSCFTAGPVVIYGTLATTPPLAVAVGAALVAGLLFGPINPIFTTVIQSHTPPIILGRVFGTASALAQAGIPVGAALAGVVVQQAGLIPTIVGMGSIYVGLILTMFLRPALRGMDEAPVTARTDDAREPDLGPTPPATSRRDELARARPSELRNSGTSSGMRLQQKCVERFEADRPDPCGVSLCRVASPVGEPMRAGEKPRPPVSINAYDHCAVRMC
jgi:hypothetical protein